MTDILEYTIGRQTNSPKSWKSSYGKDMLSYFVLLTSPTGQVTEAKWNQLATTPAPEEGGTVNGFIEQDKYGPKFVKKDPKFEGQANTREAPAPSRSNNGRDSHRIERQHSQEMAIRALELAHKLGTDIGSVRALVKTETDWYATDISNCGGNISPAVAEGQDSAIAEEANRGAPSAEGGEPDTPSPPISSDQHAALTAKIKEYEVPKNTLRLLLMSAGVNDPQNITVEEADRFDQALEAYKNGDQDENVGADIWEQVD